MVIKIGNTDISKIKISSGATPRLPSTYQEVEYIESSGTQYINTGFYPTGSSEIEFDFMMLPSSGAGSFGVDSGWTNSAFSVFTDRMLCYGSQYQSQSTYFTDNTKYKLEFKNLTGYLNGTQRFTYTAQTFTSSYSCYVFAKRRNNSIEMYAKCRVYGLKLWNNSTLERDFVPCYRMADGVIGLYDLVNNAFYTNSGTGTFTKGDDVNIPYKDIKKVYLGSTQIRPKGWTPGANTIAYYKIDDNDTNSTIYDHSGNSNDLTWYKWNGSEQSATGTYTTDAIYGRVAVFGANSEKTYASLSGYLNPNTTTYTINILCKYSIGGAYFSQGSTSSRLDTIGLHTDYNPMVFIYENPASPNSWLQATSQQPTNTWYLISCVRDGSNIELYYNGVLNNSKTDSNISTDWTSGGYWQLGANRQEYNHLNGQIKTVIFENKARTQQEILDLATEYGLT